MQVGGNAKAVRLENIIHPLIEFFKRSHYFYYPSRGAVADFAGPRTLIVVSNSFFLLCYIVFNNSFEAGIRSRP